MEIIKDTVKNVLQALKGQQQGAPKNDPGLLLRKILTKGLSTHIKCNYFRNGLLDVSVDSSVLLYRLSLQKHGLILKLNKKTKSVKDIRFRLGDIG